MKMQKLRRSLFFTIVLLAITIRSYSQANFIWGRQWGTDQNEYVLNHVIDACGNIYISGKTAGSMTGINFGQNDGFITKIDSTGTTLWTRQFGSSGDEDIQWSAIDKLGNVYITGSTSGNLKGKNFGKEDIFVVKYNPRGEMVWSKQFGTDSTDIGKGIFADNKGFVYITGTTLGTLGKSSFGKADAFVIKLDANGEKLFTYQFGTQGDDCSNSITGDNNSALYTCGTTWGDLAAKNKGMIDAFALKLTDKGVKVQCTQFGSEGFDIPMVCKVDATKSLYVGGTTSGNIGGEQLGEGDCFLVKISNQADIVWSKQFGTSKHDGIRGIDINEKASDNILVSGLLSLPPAQAFMRMYSKTGEFLWEKNVSDVHANTDSSGKEVIMDDNGTIYLLGLTQSSLFGPVIGGGDFFLIRLQLDKGFLN
jgi:hypothetical protein